MKLKNNFLFLLIACTFLTFAACKTNQNNVEVNNTIMETTDRPALKYIVTMAAPTVEKQLTDSELEEAKDYIKASKKTVPADLLSAIEKHEVWKGMSVEEVIHSIGQPSENAGGKLFYRIEGWLLRFDDNGYLIELYER